MTKRWLIPITLTFLIINFTLAVPYKESIYTGKKLYEVWEENVPVMGHLAVALDGSVLIFKEQREKKLIEKIKFSSLGIPIRNILINSSKGPGLHEIFYILGKKTSIERIKNYISKK